MLGWASVNASKSLYANLFYRMLHAPVSFFDTTPIGRILNRFTKVSHCSIFVLILCFCLCVRDLLRCLMPFLP